MPESMQVPAIATTGTPLCVQHAFEVQGTGARSGWHTDALAEIGKMQHRAEHLAVEGRTDVRVGGVTNTQDAADVQQLDRVARLKFARQGGRNSHEVLCDDRVRRQ